MPLYVQEKEGLTHFSVDESTKQRTDNELSFRTQIPSSSLVYFSSVIAVIVDPTHVHTRITETYIKKRGR